MQRGSKYTFWTEIPHFFSQYSVSWVNPLQQKNVYLKCKLNLSFFFSLKPVIFFTSTCTFLWVFTDKARNRLPVFSFNLLMVSFLLFIPVPALFFPLYCWAVHILWGRVTSPFGLCFTILNKPMSFSYNRFTLSLFILNYKFLHYMYRKNLFWETLRFIVFSSLWYTKNGVIVFLLIVLIC